MSANAMHRTTVYLPKDIKLALRRLANRTGRSEADLIRTGITQLIAESSPPKPRGAIFASGQPNLAGSIEHLLTGDKAHGIPPFGEH